MDRLLHPIIFVLAALLVFEEWLWDALQAGLRRLAALSLFRAVDRGLRRLGPWSSLLVLLFPALVLFPFKIAALWALAHGHSVLGLGVLIAAKLTGTALAAYLFDIVRDRARELPWFDRLYVAILSLLARAKAWLRAQPAYLAARQAINRGRETTRRWASASGGAGRMRRKLRAAKELFGRR